MQLKYESAVKIYGFNSPSNPYNGKIDEIIIREVFKPRDEYKSLKPGLGDYKIIIKSKISDEKELFDSYQQLSEISRQIDRAWLYACGHPLTKSDFSLLTPHLQSLDGKISGWRTNYRATKKKLRKGKPSVNFKVNRQDWAFYSVLPLEHALNIRTAILSSSDLIQSLIELHFYAHKVKDDYSRFFFFAKALEIVRKLLPGKDDKQKEKNLPFNISKELSCSLHSLYDLSNNRYETRHIMQKKKQQVMHQKMTVDEIRSFKHNADIILRAVTCQNLGIDYITINRDI